MPSVTPPAVRWIGPHDGPEFAAIHRQMSREGALLAAGDPRPANVSLYATPRPLADPAALRALTLDPAAGEVVQLLGVWCEGEERTGRTVEGARRLFWHAFPGWWRHRLDPAPIRPLRVRIESRDSALATSLIDALRSENLDASWSRRSLSPDIQVVLWDGVQLGGLEADHLAAVCRTARWSGLRVVALVDFPRPETIAAALSIGVAEVLAKPCDLGRLADALRRHAAAPCGTAERALAPATAERQPPIAFSAA